MLDVVEAFGHPSGFANWKGNDPCNKAMWSGIFCHGGNITVVNFQGMGLTGYISPKFAAITSLEKLILSNNNISGVIPDELTSLGNLIILDVKNNQLHGVIPSFNTNVIVKTSGNVDIGRNSGPGPTSSIPLNSSSLVTLTKTPQISGRQSSTGVVVGSVVGGVCAVFGAGIVVFYIYKGKHRRPGRVQSPNTRVIHPRHSGSDDAVKITGSSIDGGTASETLSLRNSEPSDMHIVEASNMVISIQVLRNITNNFSQENILGRGGFGTVYKGELHDGTKIAVKRMSPE